MSKKPTEAENLFPNLIYDSLVSFGVLSAGVCKVIFSGEVAQFSMGWRATPER